MYFFKHISEIFPLFISKYSCPFQLSKQLIIAFDFFSCLLPLQFMSKMLY